MWSGLEAFRATSKRERKETEVSVIFHAVFIATELHSDTIFSWHFFAYQQNKIKNYPLSQKVSRKGLFLLKEIYTHFNFLLKHCLPSKEFKILKKTKNRFKVCSEKIYHEKYVKFLIVDKTEKLSNFERRCVVMKSNIIFQTSVPKLLHFSCLCFSHLFQFLLICFGIEKGFEGIFHDINECFFSKPYCVYHMKTLEKLKFDNLSHYYPCQICWFKVNIDFLFIFYITLS